ncbi:RICIN domain-containing protein [Streptomyces uncialis]|uniref:RICIN domain-containing protein n=1 Tax=Streptomyces uncialis TaxID=1048205 RepID=UPI003663B3D5
MIRTVKYAAVAALLTLGTATPAATATTPAVPAQAAPAADMGPATLRPQVQPKTCVDSNANKLLYACNGNDFQKWTVRDSNNDGEVRLVSKSAGTCLEANLGTSVGAGLRSCGHSENWRMTKVAGGYQFKDIWTKTCLGVDTKYIYGEDVPVRLRTFHCALNKWQTWLIG